MCRLSGTNISIAVVSTGLPEGQAPLPRLAVTHFQKTIIRSKFLHPEDSEPISDTIYTTTPQGKNAEHRG
jgi:hypothetical protein